MERAGLLSLPVEVLHHIGSFLSVEDVLSCSSACHYLRYAFNDNVVWKKYLPVQFISSLKYQEQQVQPAFCEDDALTPLCENRVDFMKKINLVKNWKNSNFVEYSTKTHHANTSGVFNISKGKGQVIYKDRYLFLGCITNDVESDAIEVWDINKEPFLLISLKTDELYYECFYIVDDCLVVVECIKVKVYKINILEKTLSLLYYFLMNGNDVVFHKNVEHQGWHVNRYFALCYSMVDHYLFSNILENEPYPCIFHVWDIRNACKVGSFVPPIMGFAIYYHSHVENNWVLNMIKQSSRNEYYFQFNIETKTFSDSVFKLNKSAFHSIVYKSSIISFDYLCSNSEGWCDIVCTVYNFATSEKICERRFTIAQKNLQIKSIHVINGHFVMLCIDYFQIVDALTLEIVDQFPYEGLRMITHQFNVYESMFIVAGNIHNTFEVWDLQRKSKTPKHLNEVYTSQLYLNRSCTKLVCVNWYNITVYHFL